ncbi:Cytochrome c1 heme protein [Venturia nashicola]|uniref:Cytochrome c1 heme protein n=1 Tax=Venturia nashicola TaxID=86259 RepID=A0A4Z1PMJ9_9PEZI|nr:Cytochrome c1 heme protein [Venturia nashicola]TLD39171.1 Cytochrome c1 heme protein [Venturia nashicola]
MCRQLVSISACKHHRFTGLYEKCLGAISNMCICSGAINATELIDRTHIILDEHINLCEPCEFIYNQGILLAKDAIDFQGHASLETKREAEDTGKKMRAKEFKLLILDDVKAKREAALELAKKKRKDDIRDGMVALPTAKELAKAVKRFPDPIHDLRLAKSKTGNKVHFGIKPPYMEDKRWHRHNIHATNQADNLPTFGAGVREFEDVEDDGTEGVRLEEMQDVVMLSEAGEVADMEEIGAREFENGVEKAKSAALITKKRARKGARTSVPGGYGIVEAVEDLGDDEQTIVRVPQSRI